MNFSSIKCSVCNGRSRLLDVVDFNKSCEEHRGKYLPLSGVPIYYVQCEECDFVFAPEFRDWVETDFLERIYNQQYITVDPDYLEARPKANFQLLNRIFGQQKSQIRHLDYGGGNGKLSQLLGLDGWNSISYDPFPQSQTSQEALGQFNLITAFEVFEHVPDLALLMDSITKLMGESSLVLFSTLITDGSIKRNSRITWWYASPRNGHISLFSKKSLQFLGAKNKLKFGSFSNGLHCYINRTPGWATHIVK
jgi:hypothetical protein